MALWPYKIILFVTFFVKVCWIHRPTVHVSLLLCVLGSQPVLHVPHGGIYLVSRGYLPYPDEHSPGATLMKCISVGGTWLKKAEIHFSVLCHM